MTDRIAGQPVTLGWLLALNALAVARLTRLVTSDTITAPFRARVIRSDPDRAIPARRLKIYDFLTCPWCVGFWIAVAVTALMVGWSWWIYPAIVLAFGEVAGLIGERS